MAGPLSTALLLLGLLAVRRADGFRPAFVGTSTRREATAAAPCALVGPDLAPRRRGGRRGSDPSNLPSAPLAASDDGDDGTPPERGYIDEMNFFKADIPDEVRNEIFEAESNTQAGSERNQRLATYTAVIVTGLAVAGINTFLGGIQSDGIDLSDTPIGWALTDNPVNEFLFLSKIGGGIALVSAGVCGVLAEVEVRGRRDNVEKIWREVKRRKKEREKEGRGGGGKNRARKGRGERRQKGGGNRKKAMKQRKRMEALSEVVMETPVRPPPLPPQEEEDAGPRADGGGVKKGEGGVFGKVKEFYKQADGMAAAQALLLNKELEDRGVVEKITDETGLRVIGKDAAEKLQQDKGDMGEGNSEGTKKKRAD